MTDAIAVLLALVPRPHRQQAAVTLEAILTLMRHQPVTEASAHQAIADGLMMAAVLPCLECEGSVDGVTDCAGFCSGRED